MSEGVLKALMQLFAIIAKQDYGASQGQRHFVELFLEHQLDKSTVNEYLAIYDEFVGIQNSEESPETKKKRLTSVRDSVRTLGICKKINKTLTQKQKVVVLIRLYELLKSDMQFTEQRMAIINTVATVFNISQHEQRGIQNFIVEDNPYTIESEDLLIIDSEKLVTLNNIRGIKHIYSEGLDSPVSIIKINSVDLYFIKYSGKSELFLNGLAFNTRNIYLFASGSTLRLPRGTVYYSDVVSRFLFDKDTPEISFNAENIIYRFSNRKTGLSGITISEDTGKLIAFMGASGAGKTTLLNLLSGIIRPSEGEVRINGINVHKERGKIEGLIGYISQDDLLIEDLTVFQNLFYNAKLCFRGFTEEEITAKVNKTLDNLGLLEIKNIKVGSVLNKKISGGQRKRLNIALELIREPSVLFVDEPTSGLSSRDSDNVMDLLKELSLKGKLIFVVIHQPSSDIFKMFDRLLLLDTGGYPIYYGNPVEAVIYFKKVTRQINADVGECGACGNVNPEQLFNIIEARVVDEYGQFTKQRKVTPEEWYRDFISRFSLKKIKDVLELPPVHFKPVSRFRQWLVFMQRDTLSKLGNKQYLIINLLEAPVLAFILAFIIRYTDKSEYIFRKNDNLPAYIFMSIIVILFIGLTVSAEEIFRDRKIRKREGFLNLSRFSYFLSKTAILFFMSAIQALLFVLVGNPLVGIKGMFFYYWIMLFSVACFANMLGLNISASFNSAVTIYIIIPLLIIPQMILGGAMFSFDKLNRNIGGGNRVPDIAELMVSRWAYEGLAVNQFINNEFEKRFYAVEKEESHYDYKNSAYLVDLSLRIYNCVNYISNGGSKNEKKEFETDLMVLKNELSDKNGLGEKGPFRYLDKINSKDFNLEIADSLKKHVSALGSFYSDQFNLIAEKKELLLNVLQQTLDSRKKFRRDKDGYYNDYLADLVKRKYTINKLEEKDGRLNRVADPIFFYPEKEGIFNMKAHFYAPVKYFIHTVIPTFWFNCIIIWVMTLLLFFTLYFDLLRKFLGIFSKRKFMFNR